MKFSHLSRTGAENGKGYTKSRERFDGDMT